MQSERGQKLRVGRWVLGAMPLALLLAAGMARGQKDNAPAPSSAAEAEFFESKVRPILVARCQSCHNDKVQSGGLRLDGLAGLLTGGGSGPALVPHDADKSRLIQAVHYDTALKMPPTGKIPGGEIEVLTAWVKMGAPWPGAKVAPSLLNANGEYMPSEAQRTHWAFQPVKNPALPPIKNAAWCKSPLDRFVLSRLEAKGLTPASQADRRTLIRRATYDLIGLPPTADEVQAFERDPAPNAFAKVVDRLLADPRYGERWGRHWLDIARYADNKGYVFAEDREFRNAYVYRDWVVNALNRDLPYNQFVTLQLAADYLPPTDDRSDLAALGYLTLGRRFLNDPALINDDRIDVTCRGLMGLTVACARCHNHKFDPVPTKDYYSLYGVFASAHDETVSVSPRSATAEYDRLHGQLADLSGRSDGMLRQQIGLLRKRGAAMPDSLPKPVRDILQATREEELPGQDKWPILLVQFDPKVREQWQALRREMDGIQQQLGRKDKDGKPVVPEPERALALKDDAHPYDAHVFVRGNEGNPGEAVPRRFLQILSPPERKPFAQSGGRLELARAIADDHNPLTGRVIVNRLWLYHFGQGLVRTPSDFGMRGEPPTHPELLDWLASKLVSQGWSLKRMHRLLMLSATYQQSSDGTARAFALDPENRLLWKQNRQRLDLESLRDSLLAASGTLDPKIGGPAVDILATPFVGRRTLYGYIDRQNLQGLYRTFDFASPDISSAQRFHTSVPQQALWLMNSPFVQTQAHSLAVRKDIAQSDTSARIRALYRRLFQREPDKNEIALGTRFLGAASQADAHDTPVWQYGTAAYDPTTHQVSSFVAFPYYAGERWQGSAAFPDPKLGYAALAANGGHPGASLAQAVVRRWTAPRAATITIAGLLAHPSDQGDGVAAHLVSNRRGELGAWTAFHGQTATNLDAVTVSKGETLDFVVECRASNAFDSFGWSPVLRTVVDNGTRTAGLANRTGASSVWDAAAQFGPLTMPQSRWERYVQTLFLSNEFNFVD